MKLRVYGNRLRLRLSRGEVARVALGEPLEERTPFVPQPLVCRLVPGDAPFAARFADGTLSILVPRAALRRWAEGDDVGLSHVDGDELHLLIEKDFQCLHGDGDGGDQSDCFPNPLADVAR